MAKNTFGGKWTEEKIIILETYARQRAVILLEYHKELKWTHNIWMGVSVENQKVMPHIDLLRKTNAKVKSCLVNL